MSLFKRFQRAGYPVQMLKTQYRMHPQVQQTFMPCNYVQIILLFFIMTF